MPKEIGRPKTSKSAYKGDTVGTRLNEVDSKKIKRAVKITKDTEAGFVRTAIVEKADNVIQSKSGKNKKNG